MSAGRFGHLEFEDQGTPQGASQAPGKASGKGVAGTRHFVDKVRDAEFHMVKAAKRELMGEHEKALQSLSAALGEDPLLLDAWRDQLWMLVELEEYPEARTWAKKALEKFPDHPELLAIQSVALFRMGLRKDAHSLSDQALKGKGELPMVWVCRGELALSQSQSSGEECLRRAIRSAGKNPLYYARCGRVALRYKRFALAMKLLQEGTQESPEASFLWYLLGVAQRDLGFLKQARVSFLEAHSLYPKSATFRRAATAPSDSVGERLVAWTRRLWNR